MRSVQLLIAGRVQGVGYRAWCERTATTAGLVGFCRNLFDGRVEVFVQGPKDAVAAFVAACRRGPPHAIVDDVVAIDRPARALVRFGVVASAATPDER
jgi:acylphosphatase